MRMNQSLNDTGGDAEILPVHAIYNMHQKYTPE